MSLLNLNWINTDFIQQLHNLVLMHIHILFYIILQLVLTLHVCNIKTIDYCLFIVIKIKMLLLSVIWFDYLILPSNTLPAPFWWIFMR